MAFPSSLPLARELLANESGMSWILRNASANLVTISWMRCRLGIARPRPFCAEDAPGLSCLIGSPVADLAARLPTDQSAGQGGLHYLGHAFASRAYLRSRNPQVCAICVHSLGYCLAEWDVSAYTVCCDHGVLMIERCASCKQMLSWNRMAIDVCRCGQYIVSSDKVVQTGDAPVLSSMIREAMRGGRMTSAKLPLPTWWNLLSLDGALRLVVAMGVSPGGFQTARSSTPYLATVDHWADFAVRGLRRLCDYEASSDGGRRLLASQVWEGGLESIAIRSSQHVDRQAAMLLLEQIFGRTVGAKFGSLRGGLSQQRLL